MKFPHWAVLAVALSVPCLHAFPPAPYYTLYGLVRDQVGQKLNAEGAVLILLKGGEEIGRTPISDLDVDLSYELRVQIDANRPGTTLYSETAVPADGLFSLVVAMNGSLFYPIEVSGNLVAGKGGERVRLDLNLGADLDGDGLPDVWEEWQLYQAGHYPDGSGQWPIHLIDRDGDFDGDGSSNWLEYVAGTFAGDATERFNLAIKAKGATYAQFEFYGITGKTYTIERSGDLVTWTTVPFAVGAPVPGQVSYTASGVGILSAYAVVDTGGQEFYRLTVR